MSIIDFILIGILQGFVEWLPISSQGAVVVYLAKLLKIPLDLAFNYSVFLHIGTVLAAIVYFRKELFSIFNCKSIKLLFTDFKNKNNQKLLFIIITVISTLIVSVPIYFTIRNNINSISISLFIFVIALLLIVTGIMQLIRKPKLQKTPKLTTKTGILLGLFQGLSILPGISRSGITTSVLLFNRFKPEDAFKYSFLVSVPTIIVGELGLILFNGINFNILILISILFAFIVGYLTIDLLIKLARKINFAIFCFIIAGIYILIALI